MKLRNCGLVLLAILLIAGILTAPQAVGSQLKVPVGVLRLSSTGPSASARKVRRFWTPRRMRQAQPLAPTVAPGAGEASPSFAAALGTPNVLPPAFPSTSRSAGARLPTATEPTAYDEFPYSTAGKVFATDQGDPYVCSGAVVNSDNRSVVWTAGHCLYSDETETWADNWMFVPRYDNGLAPGGEWPLYQGWVPHRWTTDFDFGVDSAAVVVEPQAGKTIVDRVGGLGFMTGAARQQDFLALGYPSDDPFDGERMMSCTSTTVESFPTQFGIALGMSCDMTAGSSGGPWIVNGTYLNSNVSFHILDQPGEQFGPYFGAAARSLIDTAGGFAVPGVDLPPGDTTAPSILGTYASPNPFSPNGDGRKDKTRIHWTVSETADVHLAIATSQGVEVYGRSWGLDDGDYYVVWNGRNATGARVSPGLYTYELTATDDAGNASVPVAGGITVRRR